MQCLHLFVVLNEKYVETLSYLRVRTHPGRCVHTSWVVNALFERLGFIFWSFLGICLESQVRMTVEECVRTFLTMSTNLGFNQISCLFCCWCWTKTTVKIRVFGEHAYAWIRHAYACPKLAYAGTFPDL